MGQLQAVELLVLDSHVSDDYVVADVPAEHAKLHE
jgi:hypothetical protein